MGGLHEIEGHHGPTALGDRLLPVKLAFLFGYSFTLFAVHRADLDYRTAIKVALAADTVSIAVMKLVDNAIIALTPGAMDAHLSDGLFWAALMGGFAVAFLITTPVNKWMIGCGKSHASSTPTTDQGTDQRAQAPGAPRRPARLGVAASWPTRQRAATGRRLPVRLPLRGGDKAQPGAYPRASTVLQQSTAVAENGRPAILAAVPVSCALSCAAD